MQANPLFGTSPAQSKSPLAAVPAPALNMAAAAAAAAGKPPAKPVSKGGQPPEPPAMLQQAAARQVGCLTPEVCLDVRGLTCACLAMHIGNQLGVSFFFRLASRPWSENSTVLHAWLLCSTPMVALSGMMHCSVVCDDILWNNML
jgi:hypothetical protein